MSEPYGLKEYKALLEKNLREMRNPMSSPFGSDPYSVQEALIRQAKMDSINYALEMLPDEFDIARHSKRLVEQLREENEKLLAENKILVAENEKNVDTIEALEAELNSTYMQLSDAYAQRGY